VAASSSLIDALREIAEVHQATPAQVALAWVIRRPNVIAIVGARSVSQLEQNAAAADLVISDAEDGRLTAISDAIRLPPRRPTSGQRFRAAARWVGKRTTRPR
jgi:aryl-alcohol dehydrogenase-like predicted oxidoreductase